MKNNKIITVLLLTFTFAIFLSTDASTALTDKYKVRTIVSRGDNALIEWKYSQAEKSLNELMELTSNEGFDEEARAEIFLYKARYCFYKGDYLCAEKAYEKVQETIELDEGNKEFLERITGLVKTWDGATHFESEHFRIRYMPGKDSILAEPALNALENSYDALTKDFKIKPDEKVLVEVFPDFEAFTYGTGLTMEELENSGTIAICKYKRMMINTPRKTTRGYAYLDTLSHEFVHYLVYVKFGKRIPIWLHEGLAKYQESRWKSDVGGQLAPSQQSLLASALEHDELISFERMHPSFAKFKTPRQGQLAFAQVTTVIDYFVKTGGWPMIFELCKEISRDRDYKRAIKKVTGKEFDAFWADWKKHARGLGYKELPGMEITVFEIKKGEEGFEEEDEEVGEKDLSGGEEWRYARLGDLLRDRGHFAASTAEYKKASEIAPYSPRILNKLGLAYYLAKDFEKSVGPFEQAVIIAPTFSTTYVNLGRAQFSMGEYEAAEKTMNRVLQINPFNPIPYNVLYKIYEKEDDKDKMKEVIRKLEIISGI
jgi:tetratricopeptide (TPR) repeat protein